MFFNACPSSSRRLPLGAAAVLAVAALSGCSDDDTASNSAQVPATFTFDSQFVTNQSSVVYNGQTCRHTLITALSNAVGDSAVISSTAYRGDSVPYYDDTIAGALADQSVQTILDLSLPVPEAYDTLGELCGTSHLDQKFAGNDAVTDWKDWTTEFEGVAGQTNAEDFLRQLIREASELAASGTSPAGAPSFVSPEGIDYQQYIQKFLLGALVFQQGADDYLDDDPATPGKGLLASPEQSGDNPYSSLEHVWDEGFGYFGAARAYGDRDDQTNRSGAVDDNNDGFLDPRREVNFGASTNAAKRDQGADPATPTDFTADAFLAFRTGRAIITRTGVAFSDMLPSERDALLEARNTAVQTWEQAIAATVVHYINDVLDDMNDIGTQDYSFADHAKHWAEMKGFGLGLQFNRLSPMVETDTDNPDQTRFVTLHALLADAPALTNDADYRADLLAARALLGTAYGFSTENLAAW